MTEAQMDAAVEFTQKAVARIAKAQRAAAKEARRQKSIAALASYWEGSISQSVANDVAAGRVVTIQAGES